MKKFPLAYHGGTPPENFISQFVTIMGMTFTWWTGWWKTETLTEHDQAFYDPDDEV